MFALYFGYNYIPIDTFDGLKEEMSPHSTSLSDMQ